MNEQRIADAIRSVLLDETVLKTVAERFYHYFTHCQSDQERVTEQSKPEEKKYAPEQLEVFFNVSEKDPNAFMISAVGVYADRPEVVVFDHNGLAQNPPTPVTINEKIYWLIVEGLRSIGAEDECVHWAGLQVKQLTEADHGETTRREHDQ